MKNKTIAEFILIGKGPEHVKVFNVKSGRTETVSRNVYNMFRNTLYALMLLED